jgi:Lrp/AsnC family transcriptional regulator for asnA, asnC and gidA
MDQLDLDIISFLQKDGRMPLTEIANKLGVSEGTVRNRFARLKQDNTIQVVGMADPHQLGYDAPAVIAVSVHPQQLDSVVSAIADLPEVSYLIMVSGEYDLMVEVMCKDRDSLASLLKDEIRTLDGVTRTQTFFILHTYKMAFGALPVLPQSADQNFRFEENDFDRE